MATVVRMPELLAGVTEAVVSSWLVEVGQQVQPGTPLAEVETEKASVEFPSDIEGVILELVVPVGATVPVGDPLVVIGAPGETYDLGAAPAAGEAADSASAPAPTPDPQPAAAPAQTPVEAAPTGRRFVSPIVRRLVRERGVDISGLTGTGPGGRIVRRDLERFEATAPQAPSTPAPAADIADAVEAVPVTRMRAAIARRLTESTTTVPTFLVMADCRVDRLLDLRREVNEGGDVKISVNDFVLKAVALAMREVPEANTTWGGDVINVHRDVDIAVAVAIDGGLVTPVVRNVDRLRLSEIATTVADLAERSRTGQLRQHELEGGAFSVSNLGMFGTGRFSAIINPPHAGILAVGAAKQVPVVDDGELAVGWVMNVTLTADHRVLDGAIAAQFLNAVQRRLENPPSMLV